MSGRSKLLRLLPAIGILAVSWILSGRPEHVEQEVGLEVSDKLIHAVCYAGLAFWMSFGLEGLRPTRWLWLPAVATIVYGALDEWHQSFTPGRSCSLGDWLADAIGAPLGCAAFALALWAWRKWLEGADGRKQGAHS